MLTQSRLKELLYYRPDTGVLTWEVSPAKNIELGSVAGGVDKSTGYLRIMIAGKTYYAHRIAWMMSYGQWPKHQIDHINHARNDNRIANLRSVSPQENRRNQSKSKANTSGVTGVYRDGAKEEWAACIGVNYRKIHLGYFTDKFEAICARKEAENKYNYHENHGN